ncbi:MAG: hypothetical protein LBD45_00785 [Bacteroidales bacterium]|jgi:hypothetical protein|nr:hypothetical protein [Bacteroidales bacterium]
MAHKIKLIFDGEERDILSFSMDYFQPSRLDPIGMSAEDLCFYKSLGVIHKDYVQPKFVTLYDFNRNLPLVSPPKDAPFGGLFNLIMESTNDDNVFYHSLQTTRIAHGVLEFYNGDEEDLPFRRVEFWDSFVSELSETMSSTSNKPMLLHCVISPATVRFNKTVVFRKNWWVTDIDDKTKVFEREDREKNIVSVQWIDENTQKERKQTLSDKWVNLRIETKDFEKNDEIKINIKETNGKILEKGKTEISITEKRGKDDVLIVKKAFKFSKENINVNREAKVTAYWDDKNKASENTLKENNGGIWGVKNSDTIKAMNDIKKVFSNARFAAFNALILIDDQNNERIANIDEDAIKKILQNKLLNDDDKLAIEIVSNTINSTKKHLIEFYANRAELLSIKALQYLVSTETKKAWSERGWKNNATMLFGNQTAPMNDGSISAVVLDSEFPTDYYNSQTKSQTKNPAGMCIIVLHEIIGHGRSLSVGRGDANQHEDAILFENLLLRIMGYPHIQRTGEDHGTKVKLFNASKKPEFR